MVQASGPRSAPTVPVSLFNHEHNASSVSVRKLRFSKKYAPGFPGALARVEMKLGTATSVASPLYLGMPSCKATISSLRLCRMTCSRGLAAVS